MKRPHGFDGGVNDPEPKTKSQKSPAVTGSPAATPAQSPSVPSFLSPDQEGVGETQVIALGAENPPTPEFSNHSPQEQLAASSHRAKEALRELKRAQRERRSREKGERRRFTQISRSRRRRWLIGVGAVLTLAIFVTVGIFSPALNLQKITIVGAERLDPAAVSASLSDQLGMPLALVDQQSIQNALDEFTLIQEFSLETLPPHELLIRIVERKPVLNLKRGDSFDLVDPAGVVIESAPERIAGYPVGEALVVDVNSPAFTAAAQSLAYMQADLAAQVNVASASTDQDVTFTLANGLTIIWGSAEHSARKSVLVNKMLTALAGRSISTINVSSTEAPVFS